MPEGDVVWYTARRLQEALAGRVLTRSDFRVPRYATVDLTGQRVTEAVARGKHLMIRTDRGLTVHTPEVLRTAREGQVVGHLGPDLLGPDWDAATSKTCTPWWNSGTSCLTPTRHGPGA